MSQYPLYAELYEVNGAIYRRPPYHGLNNNTAGQLPEGGDTADLYHDEDHEEEYANDDGPACGFEESVENIGAPPGLESVNDLVEALPRPRVDPRVTQIGYPIPRWTGSIDVPSTLHALLYGRAGTTKKEMEETTRCRVVIPPRGSTDTIVRVESSAGADSVSRCLDRIEAMVHKAQKRKWTKTHFVALNFHDRMMQRRFNSFIHMVMHIPEAHVSMKDEELFPEAAKLHMTIAMVCIQTEEDKLKARAALDEVKEKYKDKKPINMEITGIDIMNDDPTQVHVLYGKAVMVPGLQEFFDDIRHAFWKQGLMHPDSKEHENVKLHMTAMNTRYAVREADGDYNVAKDYNNRKPFNAASLIEQHHDFDFGWQIADTISICEFGSTNWTSGFYETIMEEKVGEPTIERYKPKVPPPPFVWYPTKKSTLAKMPLDQHREKPEWCL